MPAKGNDNSVNARRREIILGRLHGESTASLASKLGVSSECISKAYRALPKRFTANNGNLFVRELPKDEEIICNVCLEYLDGATENHLMKKHGMTEEELYACFYAVTDRIACYNLSNQHRFVYTIVVSLRYELNLSMTILAEECGHTLFTFKEIMKGWKHMPFDVAKKLTEILGITVTDLWDDAIVPDVVKRGHQKKLLQRRAKAYFVHAVQNDSIADCKDAVYWVYYRYMKKKEATSQ